jgi:hypothetical protein
VSDLKNCWEIMDCGRQKGGEKVSELGECVASKEQFGHRCWAMAGTLCGGVLQGMVAEKSSSCLNCIVYKTYNRMRGVGRDAVQKEFPDENKKYLDVMGALRRARLDSVKSVQRR